jgi:hypothetical protein
MVQSLLIGASVCGAHSWDCVLAKALYLCMMVATGDGVVGGRRARSESGYYTRLKDMTLRVSKKDGVIFFNAEVMTRVTRGDK